jgi:single-strand DNA-binding protein
MSNLNKVFLMGRLTRDPELRYTPQGVPVCELGLAVNREYSTTSGERRKETLFIDVTVWRRQGEVCAQYLAKGRPIFIEGRLAMDTWEGQDGQKRTRYRVVAENFQFLGGGDRREGTPEDRDAGSRSSGAVETSHGTNYRQPRVGPEPDPVEADGGGGNGYGSSHPSIGASEVPF